ncbi:MAG: SNF2-related protein [Desulfurococcaceae archaeon]|nr:SNF2-related protein [Desulfurococcaceae archaeon]
MQVNQGDFKGILKLVLDPLFRYNPFFTLYYNPFSSPPAPEVPRKPYYNYIHQLALVVSAIPRRSIRILVGDEVGLGKTIEAIRLVKYLVTVGEAKRILIIAPRCLIRQWLYHEIRDLLYSPRVVKKLSRKNIEFLLAEIEHLADDKPLVLLAPMDLVKRGSTDKHTRGWFKPYYDFVSSVDWDLIIVDEAHHIGFTRSSPSLRTERIAPLCTKAKHLILLSATPSRGTHKDIINRIGLLIPEAVKSAKELEKNPYKRRLFYEAVSDYVVYRRLKEHVNLLENKEVFTKLHTFLALVRLDEYKRLYEELGEFLGLLFKSIDPGAPTLLKVIMLKRALSSPYAFLKTFTRVVENRSLENPRISYSDYLLERDPDKVVEATLARSIKLIPQDLRDRALKLLSEFTEIYEKGDPACRALAHLLFYATTNPSVLPRELHGDYIVFSEYRDTVEYLYEKIADFLISRGFIVDDELKHKVIRVLIKKLEEETSSRALRRSISLLDASTTILRGSRIVVLMAKLSSSNQEIAHLLPDLVDAIEESINERVLKILVSTDVASEGLNLQEFNVVINYDVTWSPIRRDQRIGRVYRLRQRRNCVIVDFVRDTRVEYDFYTRLVHKLLNIVDQKLVSRPIEGILELYLTRREPGGEYLVISEKSIGLALAELYEKYYVEGESIDIVLERAYRELLEKLRKYRDLVEELASRVNVDLLREVIEDFTGCSSHLEFEEAMGKVLDSFFNEKISDVAKAIRELYEKLSDASTPPANTLLVVDDPDLEEGYLGILNLLLDSKVRYSLPVLAIRERGESRLYWGIKVLEWLVEHKPLRVLYANGQLGDQREAVLLRDLVARLVKRLEQDVNNWIRSREQRLSEIIGEFTGFTGSLDYRLGETVVSLVGAQGLSEYKAFKESLPEELRDWMEEVSVNYVAKLYEERGCRILEKNIGVTKPYDILVECPGREGPVKLYVEVKSHLKKILVAELTDSETRFAEANPYNYVVCNVMGLEDKNPATWTAICGVYAELPKRILITTREEKRARIIFA